MNGGRGILYARKTYVLYVVHVQGPDDLYAAASKDELKIAGHASEEMTRNYKKEHDEVIWSDANPDRVLLRQFCAGFAQTQKSRSC